MKKGIWEKIFSDVLFEGDKVPSREERKKMYDRCFRRVKRMFKKQRYKPTKEEFAEELEGCLRDQLIRFQLEPEPTRKFVGTDFDTREINREKEERELAEDIRRLGNINRNFWESEREDLEEKRQEQNKKLKKWIEEKVREESGYYD